LGNEEKSKLENIKREYKKEKENKESENLGNEKSLEKEEKDEKVVLTDDI